MNEILKDLEIWFDSLTHKKFSDFVPEKTAIISVDMIKGFCDFGVLSSLNHKEKSTKIADFFLKANQNSFKNFILIQDRHNNKSTEFDTFPIHANVGSKEEETIDEIANLTFFKDMKIFYKNSLSIAYSDDFNLFLNKNSHIDTFIVVGVCTDLCVYSAISHLCLSANEKNIKRSVYVPSDLVATYDLQNHKSNFYHKFFLYHANLAFGAKICKNII